METLDTVIIQEQEGLLKANENTDICMFWYYPKKKLLRMNDRTAEMYNCRKEYTDMPQSFADDFIHPSTQDAFLEMHRRIDAGEKTAQASFSSIDRKRWCTVTLTVISADEQGKPEQVYGIVQNISEMKLREAEEAAFLSHMSYDIRTQMNTIVGLAAIAAVHMDDRNRVRDCIEKITASSRNLLSIIDEEFDRNRIESRKLCLQEHKIEESGIVCRQSGNLFGRKILLVEDNELNRQIVVDILTAKGLIVDTAENGLAAMTKAAAGEDGAYDMVLMDIQMPFMDGYETARAIRAMASDWAKKVPIFAMTAKAFEEDKAKALEAGMNGHLTKPIDMDRLLETLEEVLG